MIIEKNINEYIIFYEDSLSNALSKIDKNKHQFIIAVDQSRKLVGVLTDGDFRRWLLKQKKVDLSKSVNEVINKNGSYAYYNDNIERINSKFNSEFNFVPLIDENKHLVAIAKKQDSAIKIGKHLVGEDSPVLVIAEIGNNHNGSLDLAKQLIDEAIKAGADFVKFQLRSLENLYRNQGNASDESADLGEQYLLDLLSRFQLSNDEMFFAFDYAIKKGIFPLCTPFDLESLGVLEQYGIDAYKVASADLTNHELISAIANTYTPLICSTGMSHENEIIETVKLLKNKGAQYILMHCNSTYPAPFKDINLNYIKHLKKIGECPVGYSGHERGINVAIAAVSMGARMIEKHFTFDKTMEGNDHKVSLLPNEFKKMVNGIRDVETSLGNSNPRILTQGERLNREILGKSLIINKDLNEGEIITEEMIEVKSPGRGIPPYRKSELIGTYAKKIYRKGDFFFSSDIDESVKGPRTFSFNRPFGVPVRYHDFHAIYSCSNFDFVEFHLSYKDLEIDIKKIFNKTNDTDYIVHSPELFSNDHILDLCSPDKDYRNHSIEELQRVIEITKELNKYFPKTELPKIVVNVGGTSKDSHLEVCERQEYYERLSESLHVLNTENIEFIPQTMPPLPWHFGGQRYHNLFVDPDEIVAFCKKHRLRVCLDTSHAKLACNYFKYSFHDFLDKVGPYTAHVHIADAKGTDGEGLQIDEGETDFFLLSDCLDRFAPKASFIPEIWQGHNNQGEGFWVALAKLEKYFVKNTAN